MSAVRFHPKAPTLSRFAGVAQLAEQLICNQQVVGSIPITSSTLPRFDGVKFHMGGLQSGQMHQTVNLTSPTSVVRIHLLPPAKKTSLCLSFLLRASSVSNHCSREGETRRSRRRRESTSSHISQPKTNYFFMC